MLDEDAVAAWFARNGECAGIVAGEAEVRSAFGDFQRIYAGRPLADNPGGIGPNASLWLFMAARLLRLELVAESGVWRGHSSWLLRRACPGAEMHAFDLSLKNLAVRESDVVYHEQDWRHHRFPPADPRRKLAFFDDHVNQCRRVREAHARGFRYLILDDNMPARETARAGTPPFPTLQMLFDRTLSGGESFSWIGTGGRRMNYTYRRRDTHDAGRMIEAHLVFPGTACFLTFVRLRDGRAEAGRGALDAPASAGMAP